MMREWDGGESILNLQWYKNSLSSILLNVYWRVKKNNESQLYYDIGLWREGACIDAVSSLKAQIHKVVGSVRPLSVTSPVDPPCYEAVKDGRSIQVSESLDKCQVFQGMPKFE